MSERLNVTLKLASREYPVQIPPEKEESLRRGLTVIKDMMQLMQSKYQMKDAQDCLALVAIQLAHKLESEKSNKHQDVTNAAERLAHLEQLLEEHTA